MGLYINQAMVRTRLVNKVRFTNDADGEPDKMPLALLQDLILQAEGEVEFDLSPRYMAPFQTDDGCEFRKLQERPTKQVIRILCVLKAVMRVLDTDFGKGSASKGSTYYEDLKKTYDALLDKQVKIKEDSFNIFVYPPLPGMMLNYMNQEADTGFRGRVLSTNTECGGDSFASNQINDPSRSLWNPDPKDFGDWVDEWPAK